MQSHYASLHAKQAETIRCERRFEKALLQHDLIYADLADDIQDNESLAKRALKDAKQFQTRVESLKASLKQKKRSSTGIAASIANLFWPARFEVLKQRGEHLQKRFSHANESLASARDSLANTQATSKSVSEPLRKAEQELLGASQALTKTHREVRHLRNSIDSEILNAINTRQRQNLEGFISQCPQSGTLRECITELRQHQVEHAALKNALSELDSPLNDDKARFTDATAQLATSIGAGFVTASRKERVKSNVSCSVAFRAASVSTSPSHRLEGKAQGRGQLNAHYEYRDISWKEDERFRESLNAVSSSTTQLASIQALHAVRSTEIASAVYAIKNCLAFIRAELEKDFEVYS